MKVTNEELIDGTIVKGTSVQRTILVVCYGITYHWVRRWLVIDRSSLTKILARRKRKGNLCDGDDDIRNAHNHYSQY